MTKREKELGLVILSFKSMINNMVEEMIVVEAGIVRAENRLGLSKNSLRKSIGISEKGIDIDKIKEFMDNPQSLLKEGVDKKLLEEEIKQILEQY